MAKPAESASDKKKVAVVLSGCGHRDGSEITEAVSALIALSEAGAQFECFAPDVTFAPISHSVDASPSMEDAPLRQRNALEEAGRIARGRVRSTEDLREGDFDALVFPGGMGAARRLSNWAEAGARCEVRPEVAGAIRAFRSAAKPIGAICIAPTLLARVLGEEGVTVTVGDDSDASREIEKTGARHARCAVDDYVSDRDHKILTTPAYMHANARPHEVFAGVRAMIRELVEMA